MSNIRIDVDKNSGNKAKRSGNPNIVFNQLTSEKQKSNSEIKIFTDGSKTKSEDEDSSGSLVGAAFWIPRLHHVARFKLSSESSSFAAEAHAIIKALDFINHRNILHSNICSDSLSCLLALVSLDNGKYKLCPLVRDIRRMLYFLYKNRPGLSVRFSWCPVHCGVRDNERVDMEAKLASTSGQFINNKVDYRQLTSHLSDEYLVINNNFINSMNVEAGNFYMRDFTNLNIRFISGFSTNRENCCRLIRIITGYAHTNYFLFKIGALESPECECGFNFQDLNHILWACHRFDTQRRVFIDFLLSVELFPPFSIHYLIANLDINIANHLIKFLNSLSLKL